MTETATELREKYGIQTKELSFDFNTLYTEEAAGKLKAILDSVQEDVAILINNVGVIDFGTLGEREIWKINLMINVNINAQTYMSNLILPRLLKRENRSAIINIASRAAFQARAL